MVAADFERFAVYRGVLSVLARKSENFGFSAFFGRRRRRRNNDCCGSYRTCRRRVFNARFIYAPDGVSSERFDGGGVFYGARAAGIFADC